MRPGQIIDVDGDARLFMHRLQIQHQEAFNQQMNILERMCGPVFVYRGGTALTKRTYDNVIDTGNKSLLRRMDAAGWAALASILYVMWRLL